MNSARAAWLLDINRRFYLEHGHDFAATRGRVQPGVRRVMQAVLAQDTILDLGCGNGTFARTLSENGHKGQYLGLDFSPVLLKVARQGRYEFPVTFLQGDLAVLRPEPRIVRSDSEHEWAERAEINARPWAVISAFAVLHHLPGESIRLNVLRHARHWLRPSGRLVLSNWQFSSNARTKSRILPWSRFDLGPGDVDEGDHLIDWRGGAAGVRYVHEFRESELSGLAAQSGFRMVDSFFSDGTDRRSGLYQIWKPA